MAGLIASCAGQRNSVIIIPPDPSHDNVLDQADSRESWQIIESQNGMGDEALPAWVRFYLDDNIRYIESLDEYRSKYMFVGESRGENFTALQQWANGFVPALDFPRLVVQRVEQRFVGAASLYPDDEYGEYFASMIKEVSDAEYSGVVREQVFWIKKKISSVIGEDTETPQIVDSNRYEFLVLISSDRELLQSKIREIMAGIRTTVPPTREQAAAVNRINRTFFEGF